MESTELAGGSDALTLPADLRTFNAEQRWTFARTMPEWPHEYIVREQVDDELLQRLVVHIRTHGVEGWFYESQCWATTTALQTLRLSSLA